MKIQMNDEQCINYVPFHLKDGQYEQVILFVHGLGEHIGRYEEMAEFFYKANLGVVGFDLRGHGLSEGKRGHMVYEKVFEDIDSIIRRIKNKNTDAKIVLYGHSLGGNIVLSYLASRLEKDVSCAVVTSPLIETDKMPSPFLMKLIKLLAFVLPFVTIKNGLNAKDLSHDEECVKKYSSDPLVHDKISFGLFNDAMSFVDIMMEYKYRIPIRLVHGSMDKITNPKGSERFYSNHKDITTLKIYDCMFHETHNDFGNEQVLKDTLSWLNRQMKGINK